MAGRTENVAVAENRFPAHGVRDTMVVVELADEQASAALLAASTSAVEGFDLSFVGELAAAHLSISLSGMA
jgi:hypothetical protein